MNEIQLLVQQRMKQIQQINNKIDKMNKTSLQQLDEQKLVYFEMNKKLKSDQKIRIEKQNWIINILKSIKFFSYEKKKQFINQSLKIMTKFQQIDINQIIDEQQLQNNFTEQFVNLYAIFFQKLENKFNFKVSIRHIIRPNNRTIITDLVRYLVDFTRDYFKQFLIKVKQILYPQNSLIIDNNAIMFPTRLQKTDRIKQKVKKYSDEIQIKMVSKQQIIKPIRISTNQQILFLDQSNRTKPDYKSMKLKEIEDAATNIYINLKDKNYAIKYSIQNWRNQAFGDDQKHLNYNYHNLYTKKQIEQIQQKLESKKNQIAVKSICQTEDQLKSVWQQIIKCEIENQHQIRREKLKPINSNINFIIHLRLHNHKAPIEVLEFQNKISCLNQQKKFNDKNIVKQQCTTNVKNIKIRLESIKPSPSLTLKRAAKDEKKYFQIPDKKEDGKITKFKSDIILPSLHKRNIFVEYKPNNEEQIRKIEQYMIQKPNNYSSKSDRLSSHMKQILRYQEISKKKQLNKIKNLEKISNVSLNLINAYYSSGK